MTQVNLPNPHPGSWDRDNPSQTTINYEVQFLINSVLKDEIKKKKKKHKKPTWFNQVNSPNTYPRIIRWRQPHRKWNKINHEV